MKPKKRLLQGGTQVLRIRAAAPTTPPLRLWLDLSKFFNAFDFYVFMATVSYQTSLNLHSMRSKCYFYFIKSLPQRQSGQRSRIPEDVGSIPTWGSKFFSTFQSSSQPKDVHCWTKASPKMGVVQFFIPVSTQPFNIEHLLLLTRLSGLFLAVG